MDSNVITLTSDNFEEVVLKSNVPVLVDFWATWCGPCRMVSPVIDSLAEEYQEKVQICKLNVDEQPEIAARFKIMSIPTVMVFKNGEVNSKTVGARTREEYQTMINDAI